MKPPPKWKDDHRMLCKLRQFITGETVPFQTLGPFRENPHVHMSRLIEHTMDAKEHGRGWVRVSTEDLFLLLAQRTAADLRVVLSSDDDHKM